MKRGDNVITGKDSISLEVLDSFQQKMKLQEVADQFNLSLD